MEFIDYHVAFCDRSTISELKSLFEEVSTVRDNKRHFLKYNHKGVEHIILVVSFRKALVLIT